MTPNPQLHIAASGAGHRAITLLEWSPANGKWLERIELSDADVDYEAFDPMKHKLPEGCILPKAYENLAIKS